METPANVTAAAVPRTRQLRLFALENPLASRLGAEFFRGLPAGPGVYFFHDTAGALLYIGQSINLRHRVGSYRHVSPERHPRRTLRLVHRIARIEWRECGTHEEAKELERTLILEKRPPFNRAGTWPGYPWWLAVSHDGDRVEAQLARHALPHPACVGPLPAGFRHAHGSLMRCMHRWLHPEMKLAEYPLGLLNHAAPLRMRIRVEHGRPAELADALRAFARGDGGALLAELPVILGGVPPLELEYWTAELEAVVKFAAKLKALPVSALAHPAAMALPLFPEM